MENEELEKGKSVDGGVIRAKIFFHEDYYELDKVLGLSEYSVSRKQQKDEIKEFFNSSKDMDYNEFLELYNEKYGNIIKQYNERSKLRMLKTIKFSAVLLIISIVLSFILIFLAVIFE
ncbi:MAG: hypothetical protein IMY73_05400 [Bacteroidetes bacterium]|nr:hypothetical protein [Bacteroidota bacterium]